jgi:hypothetical protein
MSSSPKLLRNRAQTGGYAESGSFTPGPGYWLGWIVTEEGTKYRCGLSDGLIGIIASQSARDLDLVCRVVGQLDRFENRIA